MKKWRAILLGAPHLLCESLEHTLRQVADLEVIGPWGVDGQTIQRMSNEMPDLIILAEESILPEEISRFTAQILEHYPDLPFLRVKLEDNLVRIYSSHTLPARSADLIDLIHQLPKSGTGSGQ